MNEPRRHIPRPSLPDRSTLEKNFNAASATNFKNPYLRLSKTLTYSYLFAVPLLLLYELGLWIINFGSTAEIRIGADVLLKQISYYIGLDGTLWISLMLAVVGGIVYIYERNDEMPLRPRYFAYMFAESAVYAVVIGSLVGSVVSQLFGMQLVPLQISGSNDLAQGIVLSLGAGVYEEFLFRLVLVTALYGVLRLVPIDDRIRYVIAMVVGALIFSWVHYVGSLAYDFTVASFVFRFLMGLALNALFLTRGFGIAAMTHALYDILVTVMHG